MVVWLGGRVAEWHGGRVAWWQVGSVAEWQMVAGWQSDRVAARERRCIRVTGNYTCINEILCVIVISIIIYNTGH